MKKGITMFVLAVAGLTGFASLFFLTGAPSALAAPNDLPLPTYTVTRTTGAITIDGKLNEPDWARAEEAKLLETNTGKDVPLKSTVKVLWDDKYMYVGFYFDDPDAWATITKDEGPLWNEEVAEVFIDPEDKGHTYYEFEINPINIVVDLFVLNRGPKYNGSYQTWLDWNYSNNMKHAVYVEGNGQEKGTNDKFWTVELAFPFDDIWTAPNIPPKDGDMWRVNFYRIEHPTANRNDTWYAAFSPTQRASFHTPWRFGKVIFKK
jgi:hypothetical protein